MGKSRKLETPLSLAAIAEGYSRTGEGMSHSHWQMIRLLALGFDRKVVNHEGV